jgi:sugar phosphate isomerase/epimerase
LTYTVHLPLDLRLSADGREQHLSMLKAHRVIECTLDLNPLAYVLHLDGREILTKTDPAEIENWNRQAERALAIVSGWVQDGSLLAVENLEKYPLDFWDGVLKRTLASRCIDIGHLWYDSYDPIPYLKKYLDRTKVLHIHGISGRDHKSLRFVPFKELERVINFLYHSGFQGVMTIEVFGEKDFRSSMTALQEVMEWLTREGAWENQ